MASRLAGDRFNRLKCLRLRAPAGLVALLRGQSLRLAGGIYPWAGILGSSVARTGN
jgi:hypothetical protein